MSEDLTVATARDKGSGRNWTTEEKDLVWDQVILGKQENLPLTECFRRISRLLPHRSEAAIGMLYYNVLRKERDNDDVPEVTPAKRTTTKTAKTHEVKLDAKLIEAFQGLPEYITKLHNRIDQLESQLKEPNNEAVISALQEIINGHEQPAQITNLEKENKELQDKLAKLEQAYQDALGIYDMFTNMASISQIMSLGDFKQQMKTTLDQWGNVLKVSFQRAD